MQVDLPRLVIVRDDDEDKLAGAMKPLVVASMAAEHRKPKRNMIDRNSIQPYVCRVECLVGLAFSYLCE